MFKINSRYELPEECLFFGYGSLMYCDGINGRGLNHLYKTNDELIPTTVKGLKRAMSAEIKINMFGDLTRFYGVYKNKGSKVFGMLFKIHSNDDLKALLYNEGSQPFRKNGCYELFDITKKVNLKTKHKLRVFTLLCDKLQDKPEIYYPGYVKSVFKGISPKYRDEFLKTGGVHPDAVDKKCMYKTKY